MHLPHPLITLPAAAACWLLVGLCPGTTQSSHGDTGNRNPLGICRSAYGSLIARLMKDSLESYWHAGCTDTTHGHAVPPKPTGASVATSAAPAPAAAAGRFARRQAAPADATKAPSVAAAPHVCGDNCNHSAAPVASAPSKSWIDRLGSDISRMDHMRSVRNSPYAVAPTHKRFLSASADWRVHIAWCLDPGDAALYEIDHFTVLTGAKSPETAKRKTEELARRTIQHALSPNASLADALTGAGAAINLLNDQLRPGRNTPPDHAGVWRDWRVLKFCLTRHRDLRQQAAEEDWWADIPEVRRQEIDTYAKMLVHLSGTIRQQLTSNGLIRSTGTP